MKEDAMKGGRFSLGASMRGLFIALVAGTIVLLLFAIVLGLTGTRPSDIPLTMVFLSYFPAFIGGVSAGRRSIRQGWVAGGVAGVLFFVLLMLFALMRSDVQVFLSFAFLRVLAAFPVGAAGGMLGVNLRS